MPDSLIVESKNSGVNRQESYVVVRDHIAYLRIIGAEPEWKLMTATASEDDGSVQVCVNQEKLVEAALILGREIGTEPTVEKDRRKRHVVLICTIVDDQGNDQHFQKEVANLFHRFFEIYDEINGASCPNEVYEILSLNAPGSDVYLRDGMWLCSDRAVQEQ